MFCSEEAFDKSAFYIDNTNLHWFFGQEISEFQSVKTPLSHKIFCKKKQIVCAPGYYFDFSNPANAFLNFSTFSLTT